MISWPLKPLSEVCDINPRLPRGHGIPDDCIVSFIPMAAVDEIAGAIKKREVRPFGDVKKGFTHFKNRDVLFAKITPCMENGKAALADGLASGLGFGSTEFHVLRAGKDVLSEWLFYFLRRSSFRTEAKRNFTGTAGQQRVPTTFLSSTLIPVPPLAVQQRHVDLLSNAASIVRLRHEAQQKAAELVPAIFLEMFGDPRTNPKSFPIYALGDLMVSPPTLGTMAKPSANTARWLDLRVANIQGGKLTLEDRKWLDLSEREVDRFQLFAGDVVLARAIGSLDHLGKAVVVYPDSDWTFDSHLMRLRFDPLLLLPEWFVPYLSSAGGRAEFLQHTRHSAVQFNINGKEIRNLKIPLPSLEAQKLFCKRTENIRSIVDQQAIATGKAEAVFKSLLTATFKT